MLLTPAVSVVGHAGEDNVGTMFFREFILDCTDYWTGGRLLRWRAGRRRRQPFFLGDADESVALPGCMVGWLRAAVELAGSIEGLLKGEGRQPNRLATLLTLGPG